MQHLDSLLVGIDFSEGSKAALARAAELARLHDARLHVLHVVEDAAVTELSDVSGTIEAELRELVEREALDTLKSLCIDSGVAPVAELLVRIGVPFQEVLTQLEMSRADLLILGASGYLQAGPGGLAQRCVRKAPVDVLLVAPETVKPIRHVAAFLDFSSQSRQVLERAMALARPADASLSIVNVYEGPWFRLNVRPHSEPTEEQQHRELDKRRKQLDEFLGDMDFEGTHVACHVEVNPIASRGIVEYSRNNSVDLCVLGTRGRSASRYVLLGSVAARVLGFSPADVLVAKPSEWVQPRYD